MLNLSDDQNSNENLVRVVEKAASVQTDTQEAKENSTGMRNGSGEYIKFTE